MLERYFIPIAPYLFLAAGLSLGLFIFGLLKREIHHLRMRLGQREAQLDTAAQSLLLQVEEMRAELRQAEERTAQLVPPAPSRSGLNLNMRTQILRMFRHGEAQEHIAAKLGLPRNEVVLVLKVHKLAADGPPVETATASGSSRQSLA
jgi:hypothetical protein